MREGLVAANPIKGLAIPLKTRADAERDAFSPDELHLLFEKSPLYAGCRSERNRHTPGPRVIQDSKFWLPLIGLYSGMRLEEIARLRVCDLRQEQGVWVFDVNGQGDKKLKTPHSRRLVPVHPDLVWRGLLQYHEKLRRVGIEKLWPDLTPGADGFYSSPFSKWFGRYKKKIGIANPKLTFHSLRHTVIDRLKQRDVPEQKIRELVGHKSDSITMSRYGKPFSPAALLEVVKLLDLS
jgi:integrase